LRELTASFKSWHEISSFVLDNLFSDILEVEALDFMLLNNQKLPDGRNRLVLNGSYTREILSIGGKLNIKMPKVLDRSEDSPKLEFKPSMLPRYLKRLDDLTDLIPWLHLSGFSVGQFEDVFTLIYGPGFKGLSASTVSDIVRSWDSNYDEWVKRDLTGQFFPYLWADGVHFHVRGEKAENQAILLLVGYNREGKKELVAMTEGFEEDSESWRQMFMNLKERGIEAPLLTIGDAGKGLWKGLARVFPDCARQFCWFHKQMNVQSHLPKSLQSEAAQRLREVQKQNTRADALKEVEAFRMRFEDKFPKAVASVTQNRNELLRFFDFPGSHWRHLRTNNPAENVFSTVRLRTGKTRGMSKRESLFTMVFKLAEIACKRSRSMNGSALILELSRGVKFKDGNPT
jgi:transposase-like protein